MNEEILEELKAIAEEENINKRLLNILVEEAINFRNESEDYLSDEELKELIIEALSRLDNKVEYENGTTNSRKTTREAFENALKVLGYSRTK